MEGVELDPRSYKRTREHCKRRCSISTRFEYCSIGRERTDRPYPAILERCKLASRGQAKRLALPEASPFGSSHA